MARKTASRSSRTTRTAYKARPSTKSYAPKRYAKKKPASKIAGVTVPDGVIHYTTTAGRNNLHIEVMRPAWRTQKLPILFIHGAFDSSWIYRTPMKMLAKSGRRVYAVNLRGYSYSKCYNVAHLDIKDHLADIASVRKDLKLHKVIVAGYSSGGLFAQKHVESCGANGLVLYDPSHSKEISNAIGEKRNPREHVNAVEMFIPDESVLTEMFGRPIRGREYQTLLQPFKYCKMSGKVWKNIEILGVPVNFNKIRCPVMIVDVGHDDDPTKTMAKWLNAARYSFEGCSHGSILVGPGAVPTTKAVMSWIASRMPQGFHRVIKVRH